MIQVSAGSPTGPAVSAGMAARSGGKTGLTQVLSSEVQQSFARLLFEPFSIQIDSIFQISMLKTALYRCFRAIFLLLPACAVAQPESPPAAANDFAQQILARAGSPSSVAVSFQNVANLSPENQESAQN